MKFHIGDKVIPLPFSDDMDIEELMYAEAMDTYAGKIGTIIEIYSEGWLSVQFNYGSGEDYNDTWTYLKEWVRLVNSPGNEIEDILDFYGDSNA